VVLITAFLAALPAAASAGSPPTRLYSQDAERGRLEPLAGKTGEYLLILQGVKRRAVWFENRPGVRQGGIGNASLLDLLFGRGRPGRYGAAIDAWDPRLHRDVVMGVELVAGSWLERAGELRYRVRELGGTDGAERAHAGGAGVIARLPRRFAEAGVFIDEVCPWRRCTSAGGLAAPGGSKGKTFVQDAGSGRLVPAGARHPGAYWLTLRGVNPHALWLQDRPEALAGAVGNDHVLAPFFDEPGEAPPNAVIDAWDPRRRDDVTAGVKVLDGRWNAERRVLRYLVRPLRGASPRLPARFTQAGVFIDDCKAGCADVIGNLFELGEYLDTFFTDRNTCSAGIVNASGRPLAWVTDDSSSNESWVDNPPRTLATGANGNARIGGWTTAASWLHGCWNLVYYRGSGIELDIGVADPYSGSNDYQCHVSAGFSCWLDAGQFHGSHLIAVYCIIPAGSNPGWYCPNTDE
jgi:hypothetical protein